MLRYKEINRFPSKCSGSDDSEKRSRRIIEMTKIISGKESTLDENINIGQSVVSGLSREWL